MRSFCPKTPSLVNPSTVATNDVTLSFNPNDTVASPLISVYSKKKLILVYFLARK